jgi:hypothetical protein
VWVFVAILVVAAALAFAYDRFIYYGDGCGGQDNCSEFAANASEIAVWVLLALLAGLVLFGLLRLAKGFARRS